MNVDVFESAVEIDESRIAESPGVVREQVHEYERGERRRFDLTISMPDGLTGEVLRRLVTIPYGETRTYGALASDLDTSPIAIGRGCANNPVPLVVPCHRVVGSDGGLRGYSAADGVATKRRLIELEAEVRTGSKQSQLPIDT